MPQSTTVLADEAELELRRRLSQDDKMPDLTPERAFETMLAFYRDIRIEDRNLEADGDTLLAQWATSNYGNGERFRFEIVRQLITGDGDDEDIWQLALSFAFPPDPDWRAVPMAHLWCHSLAELDAFESAVHADPSFRMVHARSDVTPELTYDCAG